MAKIYSWAAITVAFIFSTSALRAQSPSPVPFSYAGNNVYLKGNAIAPLTPQLLTPTSAQLTGMTLHGNFSTYLYYNPVTATLYIKDAGSDGGSAQRIYAVKAGDTSLYMDNTGITFGFVVDNDGNIFYQDGTLKIVKMAPDGTVTTVASSSSQFTTGAIARDDNGNLFTYGNTTNIYKTVIATGTISLFSTSATVDRDGTIQTDPQGNLYFFHNAGTIIKKAATDGAETQIPLNFNIDVSEGAFAFGVDGDGNIYATGNGPYLQERTTDGVVHNLAPINNLGYRVTAGAAGEVFYTTTNPSTVWKYSGGAPTYSVPSPLPAGLSIDAATGVISGTPTDATAFNSYVVNATNGAGTASTNVNISVAGNFFYADNPVVLVENVDDAQFIPTHDDFGPGVLYSITPGLPNGMHIDGPSGTISGTPAGISAHTVYTVTATTGAGSITTPFELTVNDIPPATLAYNGTNFILYKDSTYLQMSPDVTGGTPTSFSITPDLPEGLALNPVFGTITGQATEPSPLTTYTVRATNSGGTATTKIHISVRTFSYTAIQVCATSLPYVWNGRSYPGTSKHAAVFKAAGGYDSTAILLLTVIRPVIKVTGKTSVCYGGTTNIKVSASRGVLPYRYSIDGINYQDENLFALPAGSYTVYTEDNIGCAAASYPVTITQPADTLSVTANVTNVSCKGGNDGSAELSGAGGYGGYTYGFGSSPFQPGFTFTGLARGGYNYRVKDAGGCIATSRVTVSQPTNPCVPEFKKGAPAITATLTLEVKALPNPSPDEFFLTLNGGDDKTIVEIRVTDITGRPVYQTRGTVYDNFKFGRNFAAGIYTVQVLNGKELKTIKLVKAK